MVFAHGTPIEGPGGFRPIEDFEVGDKVLAASLVQGAPEWEPLEIGFSNGTGPGTVEPAMVFISFGDGQSLIVSIDHLLLLHGGKLQRANRLNPGNDSLTGTDGSALPVESVSLGHFNGGVHHVAVGQGWQDSLDGHLLNSAGIITADYATQIHGGAFVDNPDAPAIGTRAYHARANPI